MKILALEFSSDLRSVAVLRPGRPPVQASEHGGPSTRAIALIEKALAMAGLQRKEIACLVVGLGPGSYAGIRIAIALAQGWNLGCPVKLAGVSSALAVAAQAQAEGARGRLHVAIDAQRAEAYLGSYEITESARNEQGSLRLVAMDEVLTLAAAGERIVGPDCAAWCPGAGNVFPTASRLAEIAAASEAEVKAAPLEPIYLRTTAFIKAKPSAFAGLSGS